MNEVYPGIKIGRWTITDDYVNAAGSGRKWKCRCDCGTERYVLERSLKYGGSFSCGCRRRENAYKAAAHDIAGQKFGDLVVLQKAPKQPDKAGVLWTCACSCGKTCDVPATLLMQGRKSHCGCKKQKPHSFADIAGRRFDRLTALYPTNDRSPRGDVIWHCRCDCGNEVDASYNELVYCNTKSCGCKKKEHEEVLKDYLVHVDGTSLDALKSKKVPTNNTTGAKGVYFIRGKWVAKIVFQKKAYYLGTYEEFEEAVRARKEAEEIINAGTVSHYNRWKERADADPEWGKKNPIKILVEKSDAEGICITFLPQFA